MLGKPPGPVLHNLRPWDAEVCTIRIASHDLRMDAIRTIARLAHTGLTETVRYLPPSAGTGGRSGTAPAGTSRPVLAACWELWRSMLAWRQPPQR